MTIEQVSAAEFDAALKSPYHVFASAAFNHMNEAKADELFFLLFKDTKTRLALCAARVGTELRTPFSAPCGGFSFISDDLKFQYLDEAVDLLIAWARSKDIGNVKITLPPMLYNEAFISKQFNTFYRKGFAISASDINHSFRTEKFDAQYIPSLWHNARKNLRISLDSNLTFRQTKSESEREEAYSVIRDNREARGFPLRMTWEQVRTTTEVITSDFFLVTNGEKNVASAIVFHVAPGIVQIIYWGDLPEFASLKTMNFLSYHVFQHYKNSGIRIIDIGISTDNSIPNFGLCDFKESIGCDVTSKFSLSKSL
jgi:hypothetical protein